MVDSLWEDDANNSDSDNEPVGSVFSSFTFAMVGPDPSMQVFPSEATQGNLSAPEEPLPLCIAPEDALHLRTGKLVDLKGSCDKNSTLPMQDGAVKEEPTTASHKHREPESPSSQELASDAETLCLSGLAARDDNVKPKGVAPLGFDLHIDLFDVGRAKVEYTVCDPLEVHPQAGTLSSLPTG